MTTSEKDMLRQISELTKLNGELSNKVIVLETHFGGLTVLNGKLRERIEEFEAYEASLLKKLNEKNLELKFAKK